jgi:hypothetical protein
MIRRVADHGYRMVPVPDAIYNYRQYATSLSMRITNVAVLDRVEEEMNLKLVRHGRDRYDILATFYGQASPPQNYVRGELPALHLPGVVRDQINLDHNNGSPIAVWLYPGTGSCAYLEWCREKDLMIVADVDDDYQSPDLLKALKRSAAKDPWLKPLYESWKTEQVGHLKFVEACDMVVCATSVLADAYRERHDNVVIIPNTVEASHWPGPLEHEGIRVGWAAGRQHAPDAELVCSALRKASRLPGVEVAVRGVDPGWDFEYTRVPRGNLEAYRAFVSTLDVGVAPLKRTPMTHGKSDLKWLDYSMGGAAFVGTDYAPYDSVTHDVTGMLVQNRSGFDDAVLELVEDADKRARLVAAARREILATRHARVASDAYRHLAADRVKVVA